MGEDLTARRVVKFCLIIGEKESVSEFCKNNRSKGNVIDFVKLQKSWNLEKTKMQLVLLNPCTI